MYKFLLCIFLFSSIQFYAQEDWQLMNPRPSSAPGLDIEFTSNTKGFYITSFELFYTEDAGENWLSKTNIRGAKDLSFKNGLGIVVGAAGAVYRSDDDGDSWLSMNVGYPESLNTVSIIDENTIVVSGDNSIFTSTDKGLNWQQYNIPSSRVNKTFFHSAAVGHAATDNGEIFKTVDGGENWTTTASFTNYSPNSFFTIFFKNENVGFATREHNEFYKTTDGGETWNTINEGISNAIFSFQFVDDMIGFGAGEYGMYKTTNGGDTWSRIAIETSYQYATNMYGIYFLNENQGFSVGQRGRIAKTTDSGQSWELYSPINSAVSQIEYLSPTRILARTGGVFYASADKGITWDYLSTTPLDEAYTGDFDFVDENIGYSIVNKYSNGYIYKTTDGGATWTQPTNFGLNVDPGIYSIEFVNENLGFASGGFNQKRTFKTTDGGEVWRVVLQEAMGQIQFLNEDVGYARRIGYSTDLVFKTIDGGENWTQIFASELDIGAFYFIDPNIGYMVGDDGLAFKTTDGGSSWQELDLPYHDFDKLEFYSEHVGYAIEEYGRIYKTENGGFSWNQIYQASGVLDFELTPEDEVFIAAEYGRILKSEITIDDISVTVNDATGVSASSATIETIIAANLKTATDIRLQYGENGFYNNSVDLNPNSVAIGSSVIIETIITGLEANTTYNYRVIATSDDTDFISNIGTLTTLPNFTLNMNYIYDPGADKATVSGSVTTNSQNLTAITFEYGTTPNSYLNSVDAAPNSVMGIGASVNIEAVLENLEEETNYYVRIKAEYNGELVYSDPTSFVTKPNFSINSYNPTIVGDQATINAYVFAYKDDLTDIVIEFGEQEFTDEVAASPTTIDVNASGSITATISGLENEKIYYYRIRAMQGEETVYGPEGIFSLSDNVVLLIEEDKDVHRESAQVNGRIFTQNGYLSYIQIEYGTTTDYGLNAYATPGFSSAGTTTSIQSVIRNLAPNTLYNYRIKVTKDNVDYFSENATFTTLEALPIDNFKIIVSSETCIDKNNGILQIEAEVALDYIATIGFDQYSFIDNLLVENLIPGTYKLCIRENGAVTSHCFQFEITESEQISGKTNLENDAHGKQLKVNMVTGTLPYSVTVNSKSIGEFNTKSFSFDVQDGDAIEIVSKYDCEGKIAFEIQNEIIGDSYVNPINSVIDIIVEEQNTTVLLELYDLQGSLLKSLSQDVINNRIVLNIENYPSGVYLIKIHGNTIRTHKIIKR